MNTKQNGGNKIIIKKWREYFQIIQKMSENFKKKKKNIKREIFKKGKFLFRNQGKFQKKLWEK